MNSTFFIVLIIYQPTKVGIICEIAKYIFQKIAFTFTTTGFHRRKSLYINGLLSPPGAMSGCGRFTELSPNFHRGIMGLHPLVTW
jgi:hypothetical protein